MHFFRKIKIDIKLSQKVDSNSNKNFYYLLKINQEFLIFIDDFLFLLKQ